MHHRVKDIMVDAGKKPKSTYLKNFDQNKALRTRDASDETLKYPNFGRVEIHVNVDLLMLTCSCQFSLDFTQIPAFAYALGLKRGIVQIFICPGSARLDNNVQVILQQVSEFNEKKYNSNTSIEWTLMSVINDPPRTMELL